MTILNNYNAFDGRHWETGSIANFFAARSVTAPHTGKALSEALLLGISGGVVFGYFNFAYEGYDPILALLSRNTFDPWDTMLSRLGVVQNVKQTTNLTKAQKNLTDALEEGTPAIVFADMFLLPWNTLGYDEGMWGMMPLVVYGYDGKTVLAADRSSVGLEISAENFDTARARVKKDKHRMMTLEAPDFAKLPAAVTAGIWDTIKLFTEKPPKGSKNNFGFAAYQQWIKLLTRPKNRKSWANVFPAGLELYCGLLGAYERTATFGQTRCGADRHTYADFLDEAAIILDKTDLVIAGDLFRESANAWCQLGQIVLPDAVEPLGEARRLTQRKTDLFVEQGMGAIDEMLAIKARLAAIRAQMIGDFPMDSAQATTLHNAIAAQVTKIHDIEKEAVVTLQAVMS